MKWGGGKEDNNHYEFFIVYNYKSLPFPGSSRKDCVGFFIDGTQVGFMRPAIVQKFKQFPDVFDVLEKSSGGGEVGKPAGVHLSQSLTTPDERTAAVNAVVEKLRDQQELVTLRGWYDEVLMIMILI